MRIVGLCLAAVCAAIAFTAASAYGANKQPEWGHCVAKAGGKYANSGCSKIEAGKEKFEWVPGLAKAVTLTSKMKELTVATLETVGGTKITCKTEEGTGQIDAGTPAEHVSKVLALFKQCTTSGVPCENVGKEEIETKELSGGIGIEKVGTTPPLNNKVGEELHGPGGGSLAEFSCAGLPVVVKGSLLHNIASNKMVNKTTEKFVASKGEQKPDKYAGGTLDEHTLESNTNGGPFEEAGQTITALVTLSEKVEVNTTTGAECSLPCHSAP